MRLRQLRVFFRGVFLSLDILSHHLHNVCLEGFALCLALPLRVLLALLLLGIARFCEVLRAKAVPVVTFVRRVA